MRKSELTQVQALQEFQELTGINIQINPSLLRFLYKEIAGTDLYERRYLKQHMDTIGANNEFKEKIKNCNIPDDSSQDTHGIYYLIESILKPSHIQNKGDNFIYSV